MTSTGPVTAADSWQKLSSPGDSHCGPYAIAWEYHHAIADFKSIDRILGDLGRQGWELLTVIPAPTYAELDRRTHFDKLQFFMKRPLPPEGI